jgi:hypothetical protein
MYSTQPPTQYVGLRNTRRFKMRPSTALRNFYFAGCTQNSNSADLVTNVIFNLSSYE